MSGATNRKWVTLLALGTVVLGACAFSGCKKPAGSGKPKVAVSILPLYFITKQVAQGAVDVVLVLPPGRSEHGYEPTPKEVARMSGTRLAVLVGLGMDGWAERIIESAGGGDVKKLHLGELVPVLASSGEHVGEEAAEEAEHAAEAGDGGAAHEGEAEPEEHGEHHEHEAGAADPHFWLDPVRVSGLLDAIATELIALAPAEADKIRNGVTLTRTQIEGTHRDIEAMAKGWSKKSIVTFHGSMRYFAARYSLQIAAVIEPFPGTEPTAKYVTEVLAAIKTAAPAAIFSEPQLEAGPARTIAKEAGLPLGELDPVGGSKLVSYDEIVFNIARELDKYLK